MATQNSKVIALLTCILFNIPFLYADSEQQIILTANQKSILESRVRDVYNGIDDNVRNGVSIAAYGGASSKWAYSYMYSNKQKNELLDTTMVFETGVITELFTVAAILKLSEQGKVRFDHKVSRYLPKYPGVPEEITIEHLLQNKSGLRDYLNDVYLVQRVWERFPLTDHTPLKILEFLGDPIFKAGEKIMYCRTNYLLLALIVEQASGMTFSEYLRNTFFVPLGLQRTFVGYYETDSSVIMSGIVDTTFVTWGGDMKDVPSTARFTIQFGTGNIVSTPSEIAKWGYMLLSGRVLQKKSLEKILSFSKDLKDEFIGAGLKKIILNGRPLYGIVSTLYGYDSFLFYDSSNSIAVCGVLNETHKNILFKSSTSTLYESIFDFLKPKKEEPYNLKFRNVRLYINMTKFTIGRGDKVVGMLEFDEESKNNTSVQANVKVQCSDPDIKLLSSTSTEMIYAQGRINWNNILYFEVDKNATLNRLIHFNVIVKPVKGTLITDTFVVSVPLAGYGRSAYFNGDPSAAVLRTVQSTHRLTSAFTLEACIKPSSDMEKGRSYSIAYYGFKIRCAVVNRSINLIVWHGNAYSSTTTSDSVLTYDVWQHVAVQWDGINAPIMFLNGKKIKTTSSFSNQFDFLFDDQMKVFVIGNTPAFNSSPQPFLGYIDNIRLWGNVRTEKQISDNMKVSNPPNKSLLLFNGTFDEFITVQEGTEAEYIGLFEQCEFGEQYNPMTVGIEDLNEDEQMHLNFNNNILSVKSEEPMYGTIKIYTLTGEEVFSDNIKEATDNYSVQTHNITQNRIYMIQLLNGDNNKLFTLYHE